MMIPRHLCSWLFKNLKKGRILALVSFCAIAIFIFSEVLPQPTSTNIDWPEFSLQLPFVEPKISPREKNIYLAVVVNSAASGDKYRGLRRAIRKTWGDSSLFNYKNKTWKLFFVLGLSENETEHEINLLESSQNNDIIIGNFTDHYKSVIIKTFMSHYWVTKKFPSCRYILKTDDDVYARIPKIIQWLEQAGAPDRLYGGYVGLAQRTVRDPKSKWFLTREQYEKKYWPPFCHGAFHVLSTDILPQFFNYTKFGRKPFHTDDAYIGVAANDLGIEARKLPGFNLQFTIKIRTACDLITSLTMGHKINASTMIKYYDFYTKEIKKAKYKRLKCLASNPELFSVVYTVIFSTFVERLFRAISF